MEGMRKLHTLHAEDGYEKFRYTKFEAAVEEDADDDNANVNGMEVD